MMQAKSDPIQFHTLTVVLGKSQVPGEVGRLRSQERFNVGTGGEPQVSGQFSFHILRYLF